MHLCRCVASGTVVTRVTVWHIEEFNNLTGFHNGKWWQQKFPFVNNHKVHSRNTCLSHMWLSKCCVKGWAGSKCLDRLLLVWIWPYKLAVWRLKKMLACTRQGTSRAVIPNQAVAKNPRAKKIVATAPSSFHFYNRTLPWNTGGTTVRQWRSWGWGLQLMAVPSVWHHQTLESGPQLAVLHQLVHTHERLAFGPTMR